MPEIIVKSPEDRDTVVQILARNGYTVKQGKTAKPGSKNMTVGTVVLDGRCHRCKGGPSC